MFVRRRLVHYYIFLFGLSLVIIGLGVSRFLLSIGGMMLALNWLIEGQFPEKFKRLWQNKPALLLILLFFFHIIWLWNTSNFEYAFKDIRIKLPLLLFPVVLGSTAPVSKKLIIRFGWLFIAVLGVGTLLCLGHFILNYNSEVENIREIVFFSSPIRFSLLLILAMAMAYYYWRTQRMTWWIFVAISAWMAGFLIFLQSLTGILMLIALMVLFSVLYGVRRIRQPFSFLWIIVPAVIVAGIVIGLVIGFERYRTPKSVEDNFPPFEEISAGGEVYKHNLDNKELENGYYIYRYYAVSELEREWSRKSGLDFWGTDQRGQLMRFTIMRYMSSMGLRKDSIGFQQLTDEDIRKMEQGHGTAFPEKNPILRRLEGTFYEINAFINGASAKGGSLTQRLVFLQNGWKVAKDNWLLGTGTGDVNEEIMHQYEEDQVNLPDEYRRRPHNQYITFWISFGILGLAYFTFLNVWYVTAAVSANRFMAIVFTVVAALSFLTEDTLETQIGASFYAVLYSLFLVLNVKESTGEEFCFDELWRNLVDRRLGK